MAANSGPASRFLGLSAPLREHFSAKSAEASECPRVKHRWRTRPPVREFFPGRGGRSYGLSGERIPVDCRCSSDSSQASAPGRHRFAQLILGTTAAHGMVTVLGTGGRGRTGVMRHCLVWQLADIDYGCWPAVSRLLACWKQQTRADGRVSFLDRFVDLQPTSPSTGTAERLSPSASLKDPAVAART